MAAGDDAFRSLLETALDEPFEGWDFGVFADRYEESRAPWDYRAEVRELLSRSTSLLDMGTGGGELLAEFDDALPARVVATEGYPPNVPVAGRRLEPLGVDVVEVQEEAPLPLPDASFDLVINRHEEFDAAEVFRVLQPGGLFLTQQVGGRDLYDLNAALGAPANTYAAWDLDAATEQLERGGLEIVRAAEAHPPSWFADVGAIALFLRITPWQVPDFGVDAYEDALRRIHDRLERDGRMEVTCHRFLVLARRRSAPRR